MTYVFVEDLDGTTSWAAELGGQVLMPPMAIPGVGRISVIQDDVGAALGLFGDPEM